LASVYVIAEAGVNHNGSPDLALELVDVAVEAGADAVKFQSFKADRLVTKTARKADYQLQTTSTAETQYEMIRRLELSRDMHFALKKRCAARGIEFLSTPFDPDSLDFLVNSVGLEIIKLPSGEVVNGPLLLHAVRRARRVLLSTGMSNLGEIDAAVRVMAWGIAHPERMPTSRREVADFVIDADTAAALRQRVTLLHCTTEYPSRFEDVNLRAMDTMAQAFGLPVGFSDHTPGIVAPIAAAARGAVVIEKHFTLDRTLPGPDHAASLEADELSAMVAAIRAIELALGDGQKQVRPSELSNRDIVRKSLVARHPIAAGAAISADSIDCKRPGTGRSPMDYWDVLGAPAARDYEEDELL
jgi:N-acetylneuraminate synthase